jgi:hypothetical protein
MKRLLLASAVAMGLLGTAAFQQPGAPYPQGVRTSFVDDCVSEGATRQQCECALRHLERRLTYAQYQEWDTAIRAGRDHPLTPLAYEIVSACLVNPNG